MPNLITLINTFTHSDEPERGKKKVISGVWTKQDDPDLQPHAPARFSLSKNPR